MSRCQALFGHTTACTRRSAISLSFDVSRVSEHSIERAFAERVGLGGYEVDETARTVTCRDWSPRFTSRKRPGAQVRIHGRFHQQLTPLRPVRKISEYHAARHVCHAMDDHAFRSDQSVKLGKYLPPPGQFG